MAQKSKKLYFRITAGEYAVLRDVCAYYEIESISDLVRACLENLVGTNPDGLEHAEQLRRLNARLAVLTAELERLSLPNAIPCTPASAEATPAFAAI